MNDSTRSDGRFLRELAKALKCIFTLLCGLVVVYPAAMVQKPELPDTPKKPVVDHFHGVTVTDNYRWLENWEDPAVRQWSDAQNDRARGFLDGLAAREPIRKWLLQTASKTSVSYSRIQPAGGLLFAMKSEPPKNQPYLVSLESTDDLSRERVIVDPNQLNMAGTTAIDFHVPSLDALFVAVSLSEGGSEDGTVHVYDRTTGKETGDVVPRVNGGTAGGSLAWAGGNSGFYYTRYPHEGERPAPDMAFYQQVYFHKMGTPASADTYGIGKEFPRIAEIQLQTSPDGRYILASVANGDGGEFAHYLLNLSAGPNNSWTQVTTFSDAVIYAAFGKDQSLYLVSRKTAPLGRVLRVPLTKPALASAVTVVPESARAIQSIVTAEASLYVIDSDGGPSRIRIFDLAGHPRGEVPVLPVSAVNSPFSPKGDLLMFENESYLVPGAWYRCNPDGKVSSTALAQSSPVDFRDVEVVRESAVSRDGTKIPMSIIRRKGLRLDGSSPAILTGYGGFNINQSPAFDPNIRMWLDRGGVYAVANLRGGSEYGETWHKGGSLLKKQNVFDDFFACAIHLRDSGYTTPDKLAIMGGSNGGLLMGAEMVQHPAMFRAVVSFVGIYDLLRNEAMTDNAVFNITEYGTVKSPAQFKALYAYSPYHHVVDGTRYPAALFLTGANDPRVNPANSRKMVARLQAATGSHAPILLRTSATSGHGLDTGLDEKIEEDADFWAFLFDQLGLGNADRSSK
jgi:prolyl oligopeptidase